MDRAFLKYLEYLSVGEMQRFSHMGDAYVPYFVMVLAKYRFGLPVSKAFLLHEYPDLVFSKVRFKRVKSLLGVSKPVLFGLVSGDGVIGYEQLIRSYDAELQVCFDRLGWFIEKFFSPLEPLFVGRSPFVVSAVICYHYCLYFGFPKTLRSLDRVFGVSEVAIRNLSVLLRGHGDLWVRRSFGKEVLKFDEVEF